MATRHRLSPHFTVEEFDCHNGAKVQKRDYAGLEVLCRVYLEPMRKKYGPVKVLSGFRTRTYNAAIGGASRSYHVYTSHDGNDQAADIKCARGNPKEWHSTLNWLRNHKRNGRGGLGLYVRSGFCHIDLRDYRADWRGN
jgi:uncharacterized protein YcbK (DUF882 family)